jgi:hypothetical protein
MIQNPRRANKHAYPTLSIKKLIQENTIFILRHGLNDIYFVKRWSNLYVQGNIKCKGIFSLLYGKGLFSASPVFGLSPLPQ